jgi:hypothetical protein
MLIYTVMSYSVFRGKVQSGAGSYRRIRLSARTEVVDIRRR